MDDLVNIKNIKNLVKSSVNIEELRELIDAIDLSLISMINQRLNVAVQIGAIKATEGRHVLDKAREVKVINRLIELNEGPLTKDLLIKIFTDIISEARNVQSPVKVAYLGPEATYTHMAAMNCFGRSTKFISQSSIKDVFTEVEKKICDYGVVPVENSIEGSVNYTLDLFFESSLKICSEKYQPISHDLLSLTGKINNIKEIYSHPQSFGQCRKWLGKYCPDVKQIECSSNSKAAQMAKAYEGRAAIASSEAGKLYGLKVVASGIEDYLKNTTRFLVIGRDKTSPTGCDKTSVMFVTHHVPGALYKVLAPVADAGINMEKLESRPAKYENWNYFFFIDLHGHIMDPIVKETINKMKNQCRYLKILGAYPSTG